MSVYIEDEKEKGLYVIRFLNTQLKGCEYRITEAETHYFIQQQDELKRQQDLLISPANIFVPDEELSLSFDIIAGQEHEKPRLVAIAEKEPVEITLNYQQVCHYCGFWFALREPEDTEWHDEVNNFVLPALEQAGTVNKKSKKTIYASLSALVTVIVLGMLFAGYYLDSEDKKKISLIQVLGNDEQAYSVSLGNDRQWYVFAEDEESRNWAARALQKSADFSQSVIVNKRNEASRLAHEINRRWPQIRFHLIRFDNPEIPELVLSKERGGIDLRDKAKVDAFRHGLLGLLPYARNVHFSMISDAVVANQAEQGLREIAEVYSKDKQHDRVSFTVRGYLNDSELNDLKKFIVEFNKKWQRHYVHFKIELENDRLKGKSYQYGSGGYVKLTPRHWDFSNDIKVKK